MIAKFGFARRLAPAALAMALLGAMTSCAHRGGEPKTPAVTGVRAWVDALRADDPRRAYDLLADDTREHISFDQFASQWKSSAAERAWQAAALDKSLTGAPDVGEHASVTLGDGKVVQLDRDGAAWRIDSPLVTRAHASRPRDAIRLFADAIAARDLTALLGTLTARRRDGLGQQLDGFLKGIAKRTGDPIDEFGSDRAELRWDEGGIRYRLVLRKEDGDWRIDDINIKPVPKDEAPPPNAGFDDSE